MSCNNRVQNQSDPIHKNVLIMVLGPSVIYNVLDHRKVKRGHNLNLNTAEINVVASIVLHYTLSSIVPSTHLEVCR
jgi:hypothetical protein